MFKIGDSVSVELTGYKGGLYSGEIKEIQQVNLNFGESKQKYGVMLKDSPFQIPIPYFWEHEIKLEESINNM